VPPTAFRVDRLDPPQRRRKLVGDIRTMHTQETDAAEKVGDIETKKPE